MQAAELSSQAVRCLFVHGRKVLGRERVAQILHAHGLDERFVDDDRAWVSFATFRALLGALVAASNDPRFAYHAGRALASPGSLGAAHLLLRALSTPERVYAALFRRVGGYNRCGTLVVDFFSDHRARVRFLPAAPQHNDDQAGLDFRRGQLESLPTIFGLLAARCEETVVVRADGCQEVHYDLRWIDDRPSWRRPPILAAALAIGIAPAIALSELGVPPPWPGTFAFVLASVVLGIRDRIAAMRRTRAHDDEVEHFSDQLRRGREQLVELQRAQAALAELNRTLEQRVEQQAAELAQASKLAAMGTLVAGLCHELHNPLHAVRGHAQILARRELDASSRTSVEAIARSTQRIRELVDDMLEFARTKETSAVPVVLEREVVRVAQLARDARRDREIAVDIAPCTRGYVVRMAPSDFESVVWNLLSNAIDATEEGGHIRVQLAERGQDWIELAVHDDGHGMTQATAARIFEPFFTTKPEGAGTGLGLAVTWRIVVAAGGQVKVTSEPERGSTFTVTLPRVAVDASS